MDNSIILIGYSGHAFVVCDILYKNDIQIKGYCERHVKHNNPFNLEFLGEESKYDFVDQEVFIAIGDNRIREKVFLALSKRAIIGDDVYHPSAEIGCLCELGSMAMIGANAVINPLSIIGDGAIINTGAIIEHECKIGAFVHIAPGAVLAGNVTVGERSFVGARAVVKQGVVIGKDVTIGAGAVIIKDVPDGVTVVGNPGRIMIK